LPDGEDAGARRAGPRLSECGGFDAEIAGEIAKEKFTLAELDEEEQNLDRLKRWYRELRHRDLFGARSAPVAERRPGCGPGTAGRSASLPAGSNPVGRSVSH
jgi:hypothetical protein